MTTPSVIHSTFVIERSFAAAPARVFAALSDPAKRRRWSFEGTQHAIESVAMDFRPGGMDEARLRLGPGAPMPGALLVRRALYQRIVPDQCVVIASTMDFGDRMISASQETFELLPTETGTDLIFTHQAAFFEGSDGPEMRQAGWLKMLSRLDAEVTD